MESLLSAALELEEEDAAAAAAAASLRSTCLDKRVKLENQQILVQIHGNCDPKSRLAGSFECCSGYSVQATKTWLKQKASEIER